MDGLYGQRCSVCGGFHPTNTGDEASPAMMREAERIAKGIYDGTITSGTIDPALTKLVAEEFRKAVIEGWGRDLPAVDYNTPDFAKLSGLERNVYQFGSAENYQHLKSLTLALKDGDRIRTFEQFREEAIKISGTYLGPWLKTEYNTAVSCATMTAKWQRFWEQRSILPNLQYRTVGDNRVRPSHQELDNIIKPVEDVFWDTYFPPNGWNCRCDVIQLSGGKVTEDDKIKTPGDVPTLFQNNIARQGMAFPKDHPYYAGIPDIIKMQADRLLSSRILRWATKNLRGKIVKAPKIGEVQFTKNGLKELINQPHEFYIEKNQAVYVLNNVMKNAKYVRSTEDATGKFKQYHYFKIKVKGKDSFIIVREGWDGKKVVYSIVDKLKGS